MLRLPRWLRRQPNPAGRHSNRLLPSTGSGAATALLNGAVAAAETSAVLVAARESDHAEEPPARDVNAGLVTEHGVPVSLEFADGVRMELDATDPRVADFLAAAAAVVGGPVHGG